jgi:hypothetical protein
MVLSYKLTLFSRILYCPGPQVTLMRQTLLILLLLLDSSAFAMEIDQAYRLIPHQRTTFKLHRSNLPQSEARSVAHLLSLAEQAMVERVDALAKGPDRSGYLSRIDSSLWQIDHLEVPTNIEPARGHILTAVRQHRAYFELHGSDGSQTKAARQQLIQSSHGHLISAYNRLMKTYPTETQHNKQAFFDYLCALDFI